MKTNTTTITKSLRALLPAAILAATLSSADAATLYSKNKFWGNQEVGAGYGIFVGDEVGHNSYTLRGNASAYGYIFDFRVPIASADATAVSFKDGIGNVKVDIRVFGVNKWDYNESGTTTWTEDFEFSNDYPIVEVDIPVGPFSIGLSAGLSIAASANLEMKIEPLDQNASVYTPVLSASVKPKFDAAVTAEAKATLLAGRARAEAKVTLVSVEMPAAASLRPKLEEPAPTPTTYAVMSFVTQQPATSTMKSFSAGTFTSTATQGSTSPATGTQPYPTDEGRTYVASYDVDLKLDALSGKLRAYIEYFSLWSWRWKEVYSTTIFEWTGFKSNVSLASGSKEFTLGAGSGPVASQ